MTHALDTMLGWLLSFGIGLGTTGVLCYAVYHALTRTVPAMIETHRADMVGQQESYHQLMRSEQEVFRQALSDIETRSVESHTRMCLAIEDMRRQIGEQSRQLAAITATLRAGRQDEGAA